MSNWKRLAGVAIAAAVLFTVVGAQAGPVKLPPGLVKKDPPISP
jgi:hypothetical protein